MAQVHVAHLSKSFLTENHSKQSAPVIHDMNFSIAEGEFVSIFGPNGSGKSTLLSLIAGLETPDSGEIRILSAHSEYTTPKIGFVFQNYNESMLPWRTVRGNVELALEHTVSSSSERKAIAMSFLDKVGLAHVAELRNEPQSALQAYREIIRLDGENEAAHRGVAKNLMALGLYDKAVDQLNKLRAIKGDDPETLNMIGMAYTRADSIPDHFDKAIEAFNTSLSVDPDRMTTKNNLGFTYILAGRLPEAIDLLEKLVDDPRANVQHRQNLALAYGLSGRENDARSIAMQDLPKAAVEKNIQRYRAMREKNLKLVQGSPTTKAKKHK